MQSFRGGAWNTHEHSSLEKTWGQVGFNFKCHVLHHINDIKCSDPGTYELIQKVQTLQKRLIQKTEEIVEKELLIQEKEKNYIELKVQDFCDNFQVSM